MWPSGQGERFLTSKSRVRIPPCPCSETTSGSESSREPERDSNPGRRATASLPPVRIPPCPLHLTSFGSHARRPSQRPGRCSVPPCPLPLIACMATLANPAGSLSPAMPVHCEARAERAPRGGEREERSDGRTGTGFKLRETSGVSLAGRPNVPPSRSSNGERDAGRDELLLAAAELRAWNDRPRTTSRRSPADGSG